MQLLLAGLFLIISRVAMADLQLIYEAQKKDIPLTERDKSILEVGEISTARYVTGGILGTYPLGFGVGHAIQGRWKEDGTIFTWGELGAVGVMVTGALGCTQDTGDKDWNCSSFEQGLIVVGAIGFVGLRIWEIVDVWAVPPLHNSKFRNLKKYIEDAKGESQTKSSLDLVPILSPRNGQGVGLRYTF
jgi:hypothetical protein